MSFWNNFLGCHDNKTMDAMHEAHQIITIMEWKKIGCPHIQPMVSSIEAAKNYICKRCVKDKEISI